MARHNQEQVDHFNKLLDDYQNTKRPLRGIAKSDRKLAFVKQLIDSTRRTEFIRVVQMRPIAPNRVDALSIHFDPLLAAIVHAQNGNVDEAAWLVFLAIHCGKSGKSGWELCRAIYGQCGTLAGGATWVYVLASLSEFCDWIGDNAEMIRTGPPQRFFGNHRRYETLRNTKRGTPSVVRSYVNWVVAAGGHRNLLLGAEMRSGNNAAEAFDILYREMDIPSFGRLAKFDYISMVGRLGLARVSAGSTYLKSATGPIKGAQLLFGDSRSSVGTLDMWLSELAAHLEVTMQDMEDAVCNWQKDPRNYKLFRG